jgi:hypothetical protein
VSLQQLRALGFDRSTHIPFTHYYRVACSQCQALSINGIATHETGCPQQAFECKGCNNLVSQRGAYCADCS